jgi:hypothetical protein
VAAVILVFSIFALLKISSGGKQEPAKELLTGSIQKSAAVRKPPSDDQTASSSLQPHSNLPHGRCKAPWWFGDQFRCRVRGQTGCERLRINLFRFNIPASLIAFARTGLFRLQPVW